MEQLAILRRQGYLTACSELAIGGLFAAALLVGCILVNRHHQPFPVDERVFSWIPAAYHNRWLRLLADLGSLPAFVIGTLTAGLIAFRRDRQLAYSCVLGPCVTVLLVQFVLRPLVGRHLGAGLSFPSGHVTAVTAVVVALVLATRGPWRAVAAAFGAAAALGVCAAVISLGWHYPTDTFAGLAAGIAGVLSLDGARRLVTFQVGAAGTDPYPAARATRSPAESQAG